MIVWDWLTAGEEFVMSGLWRHEAVHGLLALGAAGVVWGKTKRIKLVLLAVAVAVFVDLDHLVDYLIFSGGNFRLSGFFEGEYFQATHRAIVPFHAWEWVGGLIFWGRRKKWQSVGWTMAVGLGVHLVFDALTVGSLGFYSILWRGLIRGFAGL